MGRRADLIGRRFGMLVALSPAFNDAGQWYWNVRCDCKVEKTVRAHDLLTGKQTGCGCRQVTHGATRGGVSTPEYHTWRGMIARCTNPNATGYENYGGRGIKIHPPWLADFAAFLRDVGPRPEGCSIDRYPNNDGNYEPGNVRWATRTEQNRHKRNLVMMTVDGETMCLRDWARRSGIHETTIAQRLKLGWSHKRAVSDPVQNRGRRAQRAKQLAAA